MLPRVTAVRHVGDYRVALSFSDGVVAEIDLRQDVVGRGGVFAPLEDAGYFARVSVDADAGTIVWPNRVDLDPAVLYSRATGKPLPHEHRASA
jgi:hypothetical protein